MAWKKTMQAFHTAGLPPSSGRIIFPTIGWTMNSSDALTNSVTANSSGTGGTPVANRAMRTQTGVVLLGGSEGELQIDERGVEAHPWHQSRTLSPCGRGWFVRAAEQTG